MESKEPLEYICIEPDIPGEDIVIKEFISIFNDSIKNPVYDSGAYSLSTKNDRWQEEGQLHVEYYEHVQELATVLKGNDKILEYKRHYEWEAHYDGYDCITSKMRIIKLFIEDPLGREIFNKAKIMLNKDNKITFSRP